MNEMQILGMVVTALITAGGFIAGIAKLIHPINKLQLAIQKLNDNFDSMAKDSARQECRLDSHGQKLDNLDHRVGTLETKVELHHKHE